MSVYNTGKNTGKKRSDTPTYIGLCDFLYDTISDKYSPQVVLDPCCGDKRLTKRFECDTINYEIKDGTDFLQETNHINCDMVIMNPPFNAGNGKKFLPEVFMDKVLDLVDNKIPIFMICPMGFRLNQKKQSKRWMKMRDKYPPIDTIISLPIDLFSNTLYHCEVLGFNCDKLRPHYFLTNSYL